MFRHLISSCYSQIDSAFSNESWYVCGWQEDEGEGEIFYEGDVKAIVSVELDVRALKELEARLVKTALCDEMLVSNSPPGMVLCWELAHAFRDSKKQSIIEAT
jgi:hypothetical protein